MTGCVIWVRDPEKGPSAICRKGAREAFRVIAFTASSGGTDSTSAGSRMPTSRARARARGNRRAPDGEPKCPERLRQRTASLPKGNLDPKQRTMGKGEECVWVR